MECNTYWGLWTKYIWAMKFVWAEGPISGPQPGSSKKTQEPVQIHVHTARWPYEFVQDEKAPPSTTPASISSSMRLYQVRISNESSKLNNKTIPRFVLVCEIKGPGGEEGPTRFDALFVCRSSIGASWRWMMKIPFVWRASRPWWRWMSLIEMKREGDIRFVPCIFETKSFGNALVCLCLSSFFSLYACVLLFCSSQFFFFSFCDIRLLLLWASPSLLLRSFSVSVCDYRCC